MLGAIPKSEPLRKVALLSAQPLMHVIELPKKLQYPIEALSGRLAECGLSPYEQPDAHAKEVTANIAPLISQDVLSKLALFGKHGEPDAILIRNLPIDPIIPKTGTIDERLKAKTVVSESALLTLATLMRCRLQTIAREQFGSVIQNISPVAGKEQTESAVSVNAFRLHTDDAPQKKPCDFVMMLCLEGDMHANTSLLPINALLKELPKFALSEMKKSNFEFRSSASSDTVAIGRFPIISHDGVTNQYRVRLCQSQDMGRLHGRTDSARHTLKIIDEQFEKLLARPGQLTEINLQPGEVLIVNNGVGMGKIQGALHGRSGKITNPGRWLQRGLAERISE